MNNHLNDSATFQGRSGSPVIVLDTNNSLSWGINDCSSSFQSVSSCETLESYDHNVMSTESPQVIVVPSDNQITGTVLTNNDVHIPLIKECSIRIDQINTTSDHFDDCNVANVIELPFSTNCSTRYSKNVSYSSDEDSPAFEGFGEDCFFGSQYELYKRAVTLIRGNAERVRNDNECHVSDAVPTKKHLTVTGQQDTQRRLPECKSKTETVRRPRQYTPKILKPQLTESVIEPSHQSRIESTEAANLPTFQQSSNIVTSPVQPDRISPVPIENVDIVGNNKESRSDTSDSDSDVTPAVADNSTNNKKQERSADIKNNNKQRELHKMEKKRKKREFNLIAERIKEYWREAFEVAKKNHHKKARKSKNERRKYKNYYSNDETTRHRGQRKKKKNCYSSDSDSSDSSDSDTSTSSSSDSSNDSDTTSYTSQTSHTSQTRTDSDLSDSSKSDSSDQSYKHRFNKRTTRSPSPTSDTTDISSDDKERIFQLLKKRNNRKRSNSKCDENFAKITKRRFHSEHYRPDAVRMKDRTVFSQTQQKSKFPLKSSLKGKKLNSTIESTSAGDFSVKQMLL
ncbi:hypothetical protein Bhyg_02061 [Pseudolycoriella hygida]|uniref:Uncharacterized protein n=1 Tax=Pseudolycoriella hygida TaxID=35572 RepID=A0A9Q0NAU1_9DIPT|nr:hypothetical protein Bhyg_02061 [Pseudolycoriella hygida]